MGVFKVGGAEPFAPDVRRNTIKHHHLAPAQLDEAAMVGAAGATGHVEGDNERGAEKPNGMVAVPFWPGKLKPVLAALIGLLGGEKTSVCQTSAEVTSALVQEDVATIVAVNPTEWTEWDSIYGDLYQKSKTNRVYLLDNSAHASHCSDLEMMWNQREKKFDLPKSIGTFY